MEKSEVLKSIKCIIEGKTPLLMHNPAVMQAPGTKKPGHHPSNEEYCELAAYWAGEGKKRQLAIPAEWIYRCILNAATSYKVGKKFLSTLLAGTMKIEPNMIPLGTAKYEIDVRTVVIQGNRIFRARPRLDEWSAEFRIVYDTRFVPKDTLKEVLVDAGIRIGIGDFRPQKKGWFGTFNVTDWEEE